jgi:putative transposase
VYVGAGFSRPVYVGAGFSRPVYVGPAFSRPEAYGSPLAASFCMPHYPPHLASFDYKGFHRYFLTFCTHERAHYFSNAAAVDIVLAQILRTSTSQGFAISAYCFMPDHLHMLVEGTHVDADLKGFVIRVKQLSGYHFKRETRQPLWQRYGYERVLRDDESTLSVVRYIVENPLRAALTNDPASYPFWGSSVYSREQLMEHVQQSEAWAG